METWDVAVRREDAKREYWMKESSSRIVLSVKVDAISRVSAAKKVWKDRKEEILPMLKDDVTNIRLLVGKWHVPTRQPTRMAPVFVERRK